MKLLPRQKILRDFSLAAASFAVAALTWDALQFNPDSLYPLDALKIVAGTALVTHGGYRAVLGATKLNEMVAWHKETSWRQPATLARLQLTAGMALSFVMDRYISAIPTLVTAPTPSIAVSAFHATAAGALTAGAFMLGNRNLREAERQHAVRFPHNAKA